MTDRGRVTWYNLDRQRDRDNTEQTDKHMRENKDYIHRNTDKGIRYRSRE